MTATHFGIVALSLLLVPILSALRLGSQRGEEWDLMSAYQRDRLMRERWAANPKLRGRS